MKTNLRVYTYMDPAFFYSVVRKTEKYFTIARLARRKIENSLINDVFANIQLKLH